MAGFYEAALAIERDRKMEELANIVDQSPDLSSKEILRLAARSGLIDNPNMSAILQQKIQEEQTQAQTQQTQKAVNLRSDLFGRPEPGPQEQAQQDIQQMGGGQPPSFLDSLKGLTGAEAGGAGVQAPQGFSLTPPEAPQDMMSRLSVPPPVQDMSERRRELIDAGFTGSSIDQMLSDLQSGNKTIADFDNEVAKALTARTKKKEAATKAEASRIKEGADRLRQAQKDFLIYHRETGQPAESIDYNRPDDYVVSQERRKPLATRHISEQRGGRGGTEAQSSKLLNNLVRQRTSVLKEMNKLRPKIDLNPKLLEAEGTNKEEVNRLYKQNEEYLRNLDKQIGELQGTVPTTEAKQDVKISKPPKPKYTREEYIEGLRKAGKSDKSINAFLRSRGMQGLFN